MTGTVLLDGYLRGIWKIARERESAMLIVQSDVPLRASERLALEEEGGALLRFAADGATHEVRVVQPTS